MYRVLALLTLLPLLSVASAQTTIRNAHGSTVAKISSDGRVTDAHGSSLGRIKSDGRVVNSHGSSVGRIKKDGRLVDSHGSSIGRVSSGRLTNNCGVMAVSAGMSVMMMLWIMACLLALAGTSTYSRSGHARPGPALST